MNMQFLSNQHNDRQQNDLRVFYFQRFFEILGESMSLIMQFGKHCK